MQRMRVRELGAEKAAFALGAADVRLRLLATADELIRFHRSALNDKRGRLLNGPEAPSRLVLRSPSRPLHAGSADFDARRFEERVDERMCGYLVGTND